MIRIQPEFVGDRSECAAHATTSKTQNQWVCTNIILKETPCTVHVELFCHMIIEWRIFIG